MITMPHPGNTEPDRQSTEPFLTTSGDYLSVLLGAWIPRYGWALALPVLLFLIMGYALHDERWFLVALMVIFIVAPMVMSFLYIYYMLTPEARRAVLRKRVDIVPGHYLRLEYLPECDTTDDAGTEPPASNTDINGTVPLPEVIEWENILKVKSTSRFMVFFLKGERIRFILIPRAAFVW